jgi:predicted nucleic acid-binding protein
VPLLVDTGVLYALADRHDAWHKRTRQYFSKLTETLVVPVTVIPEVAYLLHTRLSASAERGFIRSLAAGELDVEPLGPKDIARAIRLLETYGDIGFVDASVVAMAERLKLVRIATTDRRHFGQVKPAHAAAFELVP